MSPICEGSGTLDHAFIIGCGYIGQRVAQHWLQRGAAVAALVRNRQRAQDLKVEGIQPYRGDLDQPASLAELPNAGATLFYFAPPPGQGTHESRVTAFLNSLGNSGLPSRVIYISTSGVYGDCSGDWVDETRLPAPQSERAQRRLDAEHQWQQWAETHQVPVTLLRVAGIYGPNRLPLQRIRQGIPVVREEECPATNRIHADDLAQVCMAATQAPAGIYNAADGQPTTMTDFIYQVANAYKLPRPPAISLEQARQALSPMLLSFLAESRRLDIRRLRRDLQVDLRYPDLSSGLAACRRAEA